MITFTALPTDRVRAWQGGGQDAYGNAPERAISDGNGNRCRHCLETIPAGTAYLIVAHRPFEALHAYAETGPLFVCAQACARYSDDAGGDLPQAMTTSPDYLIKGYCRDERIVYGTGTIVTSDAMRDRANAIFLDPAIAFIHVRSSRNNCYQARIDRG